MGKFQKVLVINKDALRDADFFCVVKDVQNVRLTLIFIRLGVIQILELGSIMMHALKNQRLPKWNVALDLLSLENGV